MDYYYQEFYMIKRLLVVAIAAVTLAGCSNDSMSGDVYSASQAKQVQNVRYGTLVSVRPVKIQGEGGSNMIGTIGGAVLGGFLGNTIGGRSSRRRSGRPDWRGGGPYRRPGAGNQNRSERQHCGGSEGRRNQVQPRAARTSGADGRYHHRLAAVSWRNREGKTGGYGLRFFFPML
jgi:uncharacterized protein YcfJ